MSLAKATAERDAANTPADSRPAHSEIRFMLGLLPVNKVIQVGAATSTRFKSSTNCLRPA